MKNNPYALITGSSSGIGRAIAYEFAPMKMNGYLFNSLVTPVGKPICRTLDTDCGRRKLVHIFRNNYNILF